MTCDELQIFLIPKCLLISRWFLNIIKKICCGHGLCRIIELLQTAMSHKRLVIPNRCAFDDMDHDLQIYLLLWWWFCADMLHTKSAMFCRHISHRKSDVRVITCTVHASRKSTPCLLHIRKRWGDHLLLEVRSRIFVEWLIQQTLCKRKRKKLSEGQSALKRQWMHSAAGKHVSRHECTLSETTWDCIRWDGPSAQQRRPDRSTKYSRHCVHRKHSDSTHGVPFSDLWPYAWAHRPAPHWSSPSRIEIWLTGQWQESEMGQAGYRKRSSPGKMILHERHWSSSFRNGMTRHGRNRSLDSERKADRGRKQLILQARPPG